MRSSCPIAKTLDIVGDKWTMLVMRDILFFGKSQYGDFLASPENISTNILAERLRRLTDAGLISKEPYQYNPIRYQYVATERGEKLKSVLRSVMKWGLENIPGAQIPDQEAIDKYNKKKQAC